MASVLVAPSEHLYRVTCCISVITTPDPSATHDSKHPTTQCKSSTQRLNTSSVMHHKLFNFLFNLKPYFWDMCVNACSQTSRQMTLLQDKSLTIRHLTYTRPLRRPVDCSCLTQYLEVVGKKYELWGLWGLDLTKHHYLLVPPHSSLLCLTVCLIVSGFRSTCIIPACFWQTICKKYFQALEQCKSASHGRLC